MNVKRLLAALAVCVCVVSLLPAAGLDSAASLRRKQQAQEKARVLARELVASVLDIQVRQLKENGLEHLPIYREINEMRGNIDGLVEAQMQDVVQLLVKAQEAERDQRLPLLNQARDKIREVVINLMAERQKLLRRLQIAKIAAQVQQLIVMQTRTMNTTDGLP